MKDKEFAIRERDLKGKIAYHRDYINKQVSGLQSYLEANGPGHAFGEVLGELLAQNNSLMLANSALTQLRLDQEGLFATSGTGVQPART